MPDGPERACLAIADVSGYAGYLAGVEFDHAQDILADLIGTIVEAMAPFGLSKLEGDAAFAFLPGGEPHVLLSDEVTTLRASLSQARRLT